MPWSLYNGRGHFVEVSFLLLACVFWGPNSSHQAWQQVPLLTKLPHQLSFLDLLYSYTCLSECVETCTCTSS